jgi:hypothetical protein
MRRSLGTGAAIAALLALLCVPATISAQDTASAGTKLGNLVKETILAALPGASAVLDLVWAKIAKPTDTGTKVSKSDLEAAIKAAQQKLSADAKLQLTPLNAVATELGVLNKYLEPSMIASGAVARMQGALALTPAPTADQWQALKTDWAVAKAQLAAIGNVDEKAISDLWLRDKLHKISGTSKDLAIRVDALFTAREPNAQALGPLLLILQERLVDVSAAVGYQLGDLEAHLKSVSKWVDDPKASAATPKPAEGLFVQRLNALPAVN